MEICSCLLISSTNASQYAMSLRAGFQYIFTYIKKKSLHAGYVAIATECTSKKVCQQVLYGNFVI